MIDVTNIISEHWLITPAATAVGQPAPRDIRQQTWLLQLSGVLIPNLQGTSHTAWRREILSFSPNLDVPLNFTVAKYSIPPPTGSPGVNYFVHFQLEHWVLFAAISSIFDQNQAVDAGFAVDEWRAAPFLTVPDAFTNRPQGNIFSKMEVAVAVRDTDAFLFRVSYNISLLGRIVFTLNKPPR